MVLNHMCESTTKELELKMRRKTLDLIIMSTGAINVKGNSMPVKRELSADIFVARNRKLALQHC